MKYENKFCSQNNRAEIQSLLHFVFLTIELYGIKGKDLIVPIIMYSIILVYFNTVFTKG